MPPSYPGHPGKMEEAPPRFAMSGALVFLAQPALVKVSMAIIAIHFTTILISGSLATSTELRMPANGAELPDSFPCPRMHVSTPTRQSFLQALASASQIST